MFTVLHSSKLWQKFLPLKRSRHLLRLHWSFILALKGRFKMVFEEPSFSDVYPGVRMAWFSIQSDLNAILNFLNLSLSRSLTLSLSFFLFFQKCHSLPLNDQFQRSHHFKDIVVTFFWHTYFKKNFCAMRSKYFIGSILLSLLLKNFTIRLWLSKVLDTEFLANTRNRTTESFENNQTLLHL